MACGMKKERPFVIIDDASLLGRHGGSVERCFVALLVSVGGSIRYFEMRKLKRRIERLEQEQASGAGAYAHFSGHA